MAYQLLVENWVEAQDLAIPIRFQVFVNEQKVPEEMELDEDDSGAWHALVFSGNVAIGTARLVVENEGLDELSGQVGRIGRLAVLKNYRRQGVGADLLKTLIQYGVDRGIHEYYLHAQLSAQGLYEKMGFISEGDIFEEAGILHQSMRLKI
jgi:predicted GNAT family N-acyltransferase